MLSLREYILKIQEGTSAPLGRAGFQLPVFIRRKSHVGDKCGGAGLVG